MRVRREDGILMKGGLGVSSYKIILVIFFDKFSFILYASFTVWEILVNINFSSITFASFPHL